jgi:neutral ceramidase
MELPSLPLQLGVASRTINPRAGVPLVGYPSERPNTGVALDLCVRAAIFGEAGGARPSAALLVLDTIGIGAELVRRVRERVCEAAPGLRPPSVMVAATHTHSGPTLNPFRKKDQDAKPDEEYVRQVLEACPEAAKAAWRARAEVKLRIGLTEARLGHNRRVVDAEGKATNVWLDTEGAHSGYFNPRVRFVVFEDASEGRPRAILASYGCHPVVMGPGNAKVSADYPGYLVRALEAATGVELALFVTGGAGNINPRACLYETPERAQAMGEALAREILAALPHAAPIQASPLLTRSVPLKLRLGPEARSNYTARAEDSADGRHLTSEVQVLRLGELAIVSAPGELFAELGVAMENRSPFRHTLVAAYANDNLGYLPTETAFREGGYEAGHTISLDIERPLLAAAREALEAASRGGSGSEQT